MLVAGGWLHILRIRREADWRTRDITLAALEYFKVNNGASLVAQWLRIRLPLQGDTGSSPGPGRSHMPRSN